MDYFLEYNFLFYSISFNSKTAFKKRVGAISSSNTPKYF